MSEAEIYDHESASYIFCNESSGDPTAQNPTSTAFGIPQMIKVNREHYGCSDSIDPLEQLICGRQYVEDRYGTWEKAEQWWQINEWY